MNVGVALGGVTAGLIASVGIPQTFTVLFAINCATFLGYMRRPRARTRAGAARGARSAAAGERSLRDRVFTPSTRCSTPPS